MAVINPFANMTKEQLKIACEVGSHRYEVGDFVTFYESYEIDSMHPELFIIFDEWEDNQIAAINQGNFEFEDIEGVWRIDVIRELSDDQRVES